jgi:acetoacetyl-CoA reductase/3-oxoacyl-[acyl-carrier protein] reductase
MEKILITGASRGIGKFLSEHYSKLGRQIYGTYNLSSPQIDNVGDSDGCLTPIYRQVDVRDEQKVLEWIESVNPDKDDHLILINCAGVNYNCVMHKSDSEKWIEVFSINLYGVYYAIKHIIPCMRLAKYGRIVNLSSVVPKTGVPGTSAYSASKSALWGLSKAVSSENASYNITINTINLGYFSIGMIGEVPKGYLNGIIGRVPRGELGNPAEILHTIDYIIGASYLTGTEININGGLW